MKRGTGAGPFFMFEDKKCLTRASFVTQLLSALSTAGYCPTRYAGHSFRIGAAMTAAQAGLQDSLIQTLGRWQSSAYSLYICTPRRTLYGVSKRLVGAGVQDI